MFILRTTKLNISLVLCCIQLYISVSKILIFHIRNITIFASSVEEMTDLIQRTEETSAETGLHPNAHR